MFWTWNVASTLVSIWTLPKSSSDSLMYSLGPPLYGAGSRASEVLTTVATGALLGVGVGMTGVPPPLVLSPDPHAARRNTATIRANDDMRSLAATGKFTVGFFDDKSFTSRLYYCAILYCSILAFMVLLSLHLWQPVVSDFKEAEHYEQHASRLVSPTTEPVHARR